MKNIVRVSVFLLILFTLLSSFGGAQPVKAQGPEHWCGGTSETLNYGFTFPSREVAHWTIENGTSFVSTATIDQIDVILDALNTDNIANTMILFIDANDVAVGSNCAGDFFTYMELGNKEGFRADNGFAWVFIYDPASDTLELNYAVGGNLSALHADDLKPMKRQGSDIYSSTKSLDAALLQTIQAYDGYARAQYEPYYPPATPITEPQVIAPVNSNQGISPVFLAFLCLLFLLIFILVAAAIGLFGGSNSSTIDTSPYKPDSNDDIPRENPSLYRPTPTPTTRRETPRTQPSNPKPPSLPPTRSGGGGRGPTRTG